MTDDRNDDLVAEVEIIPGPAEKASVWEARDAKRRREAGEKEPWRPPPMPSSPPDLVYFLQRSDGPIKIGYTQALPQRIAMLETATGPLDLVGLEHGTRQREQILHGMFRAVRLYGEWFAPSRELVDYLSQTHHSSLEVLASLTFHGNVTTVVSARSSCVFCAVCQVRPVEIHAGPAAGRCRRCAQYFWRKGRDGEPYDRPAELDERTPRGRSGDRGASGSVGKIQGLDGLPAPDGSAGQAALPSAGQAPEAEGEAP